MAEQAGCKCIITGTSGIENTRAKLGLVVAKTIRNNPKIPHIRLCVIFQEGAITNFEDPDSPHANLCSKGIKNQDIIC